jgi:hypothetical protein
MGSLVARKDRPRHGYSRRGENQYGYERYFWDVSIVEGWNWLDVKKLCETAYAEFMRLWIASSCDLLWTWDCTFLTTSWPAKSYQLLKDCSMEVDNTIWKLNICTRHRNIYYFLKRQNYPVLIWDLQGSVQCVSN